jgi:hypothetical protein
MTTDPRKPKARWQAGNRDSGDDSARSLHRPTVIQQVQAALRSGRALTAADAWREFGTSRLAAIIHRLKREGMPIHAREIEAECRDAPTARVAEYRLIDATAEGVQ